MIDGLLRILIKVSLSSRGSLLRLHIYLHIETDHPQTPCLYGSTLGFCSHNPLVPGSSPGGPTRKANPHQQWWGFWLSINLLIFECEVTLDRSRNVR